MLTSDKIDSEQRKLPETETSRNDKQVNSSKKEKKKKAE
jgi:hypothetical protein